MGRKILSLWILRASNALSSLREIIGGLPQLDIGPK